MTVAGGLGKSVGMAFESTYGVPVVPTAFAPLIDDSVKRTIAEIISKGVIADAQMMRSTQWAQGDITVAGDIQLELNNLSMGKWLRAIYGNVVTAGAGPYTHTYTLGDLDDDSFTTQFIKPDVNGVKRPFTENGCVVDTAEVAFAEGAYWTLGITIVAQNEILYRQVTDAVTTSSSPTVTTVTGAIGPDDLGKPVSDGGVKIPANSYIGVINSPTSFNLSSVPLGNPAFPTPVNASSAGTGITLTFGVALTSPSYVSGIRPISVVNGASVTIGGTAVAVKAGSYKIDNGLGKGRRFAGSPVIRQPKVTSLRAVTGKLTMEFEDNTQYRHFVNGDEFALVVSATAGAQSIVTTMNAHYQGTTPDIKGTEIGLIELPFTATGPTSDAGGITTVYTTTESTP